MTEPSKPKEVFSPQEAEAMVCPYMRGACISIKCMAWRRQSSFTHQENDGYCGLAGRPIENK